MLTRLAICFALLLGFSAAVFADEHPQEMEKKECIVCHTDAEVVGDKVAAIEEYNQSMHSFSGVACGLCHGDEANFVKTPQKGACVPCHSEQVALTPKKDTCASCHAAHTYSLTDAKGLLKKNNVHAKKKGGKK